MVYGAIPEFGVELFYSFLLPYSNIISCLVWFNDVEFITSTHYVKIDFVLHMYIDISVWTYDNM